MTGWTLLFLVCLHVAEATSDCIQNATGFVDPFLPFPTVSSTNTSKAYLLPDDVWRVSCCSVVTSWEFVPLTQGVIYFQIWRPENISSQYQLKYSVPYTVQAGEERTVVVYNLTLGQRITVFAGDRIGWYCSNGVILSYIDCYGIGCPSRSTNSIDKPSPSIIGDVINWSDSVTTNIYNRSYHLKFYTVSNRAPYIQPGQCCSSVNSDAPIGTNVMTLNISDDDMTDEMQFSVSNDLFDLNTTIRDHIFIQTKELLSSSITDSVNVTVNIWDSCMNNFSMNVEIVIVSNNNNASSTETTTLPVTTEPQAPSRKSEHKDIIIGLTMSGLILGAIIGIIAYRWNVLKQRARPEKKYSPEVRKTVYMIPDLLPEEGSDHNSIVVHITESNVRNINVNSGSMSTDL